MDYNKKNIYIYIFIWHRDADSGSAEVNTKPGIGFSAQKQRSHFTKHMELSRQVVLSPEV